MATLQIGGRTALTPSQELDAGRRRAARYPAGWLLVEAETGRDGRKLGGRLLDTSSDGLGLVLDEEVIAGTIVRVAPASAEESVHGAPWHGRPARVAYAVPLPGGTWRVGLTFASETNGGLQIWGTRLLLLAVFAVAATAALLSDPAGSMAGAVLGTIAVVLAVGAEREHSMESRAARYGPPKANANR